MFAGKDTQINSYGGIAGIVARERQMFLVGVFLGSAPPTDPAPDRISYSTPADYALASYGPLLNQIFFIGDGLTGTGSGTIQTFFVPTGARRLYFGFADAFYFGHYSASGLDPGHYGDNTGALAGTFNFDGLDGIPTPLPILTPEPASFALIAAGLAFLLRRK
ncbi:MAG: PEP-CTERM sorting domain-containing protein [Acidobacteria bacterium]|nr:PEP-CTERM sorting domain-containing protein [Acidobacteriota bacterium]